MNIHIAEMKLKGTAESITWSWAGRRTSSISRSSSPVPLRWIVTPQRPSRRA